MRRTPLSDSATRAKALAHPARLRVLSMLGSGELCVCQMTAVLGLSASTVSAHLSVLRRAGLAVERKEAKWVFYDLPDDPAARRWIALATGPLGDDPAVAADAALVRRLRLVPVDVFAASGMDLTLLPALQPSPGRPKKTGRR